MAIALLAKGTLNWSIDGTALEANNSFSLQPNLTSKLN